ncbi:DNA-directed RNA polymerase [Sphingomonas sp.]|uniref:DNA-directed RNA polymerase n=1 Tax=Sphingomonas sp. TaxID=28214 RepID=UPI002ED90D1B
MQTITRDLIRRQIELEDDSRALGARRYRARELPWKPEAGTIDEEANLPPGQKLIKSTVLVAAQAIEEFLAEVCSGKAGRRHAAADFLLLTKPDAAAYLTLRCMLNGSVAQSMMQTVAVQVAEALIENLELSSFREQNKLGYKGWLKAQEQRGYSRQRKSAVKKLLDSEGVAIEISQQQKAAVGMKCIELVMDSTGMFVQDQVRRSRGYGIALRPSEALQKWLDEQHARCEILDPLSMPMLIRPRRWRSPSYGGYLTPRAGNRFVKQRNRAYHDELRNVDIKDVYDAANHVQDTAWRINSRVLDVMQVVWDGGGSLGGLPMRDDEPTPTKPIDIDTNSEARERWKRAAGEVYARNAERLSMRLAVHQGLWVARRFTDEEAIYYPHELDFRGRIYPIAVAGPSPQGSDWQKGLLEFADGVPLGAEGYRWLCIHIANLFGVDKVPFEERLAWTTENIEALLDSGRDPLDGQRFWTTADSPYCALAACLELADAWALDNPADYASRIPIALDGSCSGLQHFSAMLRDEEGGKAVNLLPSERPQDIYGAVARRAQGFADAALEDLPFEVSSIKLTGRDADGNEIDIDPEVIRKAWAGGKVSRSIAKRPTMTFCYSATRFGMQSMILGTLKELDRAAEEAGNPPYLGGADNYHAAMWLSHVLYSSISQTVRAAAQAMDWLREAAKVASKGGLPLWWTTPMGLPILQEYKAQKGHVIDTHWCGQRVQVIVKVEAEGLDSRSQANGVAPNFVHSLDAAHLQSVALACKGEGIQHLAVIHDSFGTHAAHTGRLSAILRETFVAQYEDDVLGRLYDELKDQLGEELADQLPPPPQAGTLDLSCILNAAYTFA